MPGAAGHGHRQAPEAAFAPQLPEALLGEALRAAAAVADDRDRAWALAALAPRLPEALQRDALSSFLVTTGRLSRPLLLPLLEPFYPIIARLEGPAGLREIRRAVCDTGAWFP